MMDPRTSFLTGLLKSRQASLVNREQLEQLAETRQDDRSEGEILDALRGTDIGTRLQDERWRNAAQRDECLWRSFHEIVRDLATLPFIPSQASKFNNVYMLKYDVANLKAVAQGLALSRTPHLLPVGRIQASGRLEEFAQLDDSDKLLELLRTCDLQLFAASVKHFDPAGGAKSLATLETGLEADYYRELANTGRSMSGGNILGIACGLMIDFSNIAILCRLIIAEVDTSDNEHFIPGGYLIDHRELREAMSHGLNDLPRRLRHESHRQLAAEIVSAQERFGTIGIIDTIIERRRLDSLRTLLAPRLTPAAVLLWYVILKEIELRNVRLALTVAENGMASESVREHWLS